MRIRTSPLILTMFVVGACSGGSGPSGPPPVDGEARVGPAGATVSLSGDATVGIPAGALDSEVTIRISAASTPPALAAEGAFGQAYRFEPSGLRFAVPVDVSIFVSTQALAGRDSDDVGLVSTTAAGGVEWLSAIRRESAQGGIRFVGTTTHFSVISPAVPPNEPPTIELGEDRSAAIGAAVDLTATTDDPDGDPVTVSWSFDARPAGSAAALSPATGGSTSFVPDVAGEYRVRATATDGRGGTASKVVVVTVREIVADAGPDQSAVVGTAVTLDGSGSVGQDLSWSWRFVSTPGSPPTIDDADQETARFVPTAAGEYLVELTVSNDAGSARDTVRVSVAAANRAPAVGLDAPPATLLGAAVTITADASDPDGDDLQFAWSVTGPPGSSPVLTPNGARATLLPDVPGEYVVRVVVSDGSATAQAEIGVLGNPDVAGTYAGTFRVESAAGCGDGIEGIEESGDLPVQQPSPGTVVLDLPGLDPIFASTAAGTLEGTFFLFDGNVVLQTADGGTLSSRGILRGTMDGAMLDLTFRMTLFSCTITGTVTGPRQ